VLANPRPSDGKIKWGYQYTPNDPYDYDEISEHPIINAKVNGEDRKLVVHAARQTDFFYALRPHQWLVRRRQAICSTNSTWTTGPRPEKPAARLNYDPTKDVQEYTPGQP